jgi:hypothetical protein
MFINLNNRRKVIRQFLPSRVIDASFRRKWEKLSSGTRESGMFSFETVYTKVELHFRYYEHT